MKEIYDEATQVISTREESEETSGTSFSAPIVSAAAAVILSYIRRLHPEEKNAHKLTAQALLESATPIVLIITTAEERQRMKMLAEYKTPIALEGIMSRDLKPLTGYKTMLAGEERIFDITEDMIKEMKRRYGRGRLNVEAAMRWVDENYGAEKKN
jgi:hypothetical protein